MTRKLLVTSALPYANGSIHLGHLVEHIQTDIWVRYQRIIGNTCHYICADDTHGTAVMLSAEKAGAKPEDWIESIRQDHLSDLEGFGIDYDIYYTTHSKENEQLSSFIYESAQSKGAISVRSIDQYFDPEKKLFLADRFIKGTCPKCDAPDQYGDACEVCFATYSALDLKNPTSTLSGSAPIIKSSDHYFFELEKFRNQITDWLNQDTVAPEVKNKLNEWLDGELKAWDISRDAPYFGFLIPETIDKYFYVWLDAPVGYIASTLKWCESSGVDFDSIWKSGDYEIHHFIGKDIMYFHTLFWPAMLSASDFQLPKHIHVHGFLTVNGEKMSKSRGTFILAKTYLEHLNPEFLRYYYAAKLSDSLDDIDLNLEDFQARVNADVINKLINIGSRLASILHKKCDGKLTEIDPDGTALLEEITSAKDSISDHYNSLNTHKAMRLIMSLADKTNTYIDTKAPWSVVKENPQEAAMICTTGLNALRLLTLYLEPVLPALSSKIYAFLKCEGGSWDLLTQRLTEHSIEVYQHLGKRLELSDLEILIN